MLYAVGDASAGDSGAVLASDPSQDMLVRHKLTLEDPLPVSLMVMMRVLQCEDVETLEFLEAQGKGTKQKLTHPRSIGRLTPARELAALFDLQDALKGMASGYTTSVSEDETILKNQDTGYRKRVAVLLRLSEKRILDKAMAALQKGIIDEESRMAG